MTPEKVNILTFKENLIARAFQVPTAWIRRVGLLLALLLTVTFLTALLAVKYYRLARLGDPIRVQDLEAELAELKASHPLPLALKGAEDSKSAPHSSPLPQTQTQAQAPSVPAPAPQATQANNLNLQAILFAALSASARSNELPDPASLPFKIDKAAAHWRGSKLDVNFNLLYSKDDGGKQDGHIVILARGPSTLMVHPEGAFNRSDSQTLISPARGEYFSVSRFRETKAQFGPFASKSMIQEIEVLIFNNEDRLLSRSVLPAEAPKRASSSSEEDSP